jgi:hypothetical protein
MGKSDALSAVLRAGDLGYALGGDVAGRGKALGLFDHGIRDDRSVLQHFLKIYQTAVIHMLYEIITVMEMYDTGPVRFCNVLRKQDAVGEVSGDFSRHIVSLNGDHHGVFIGILSITLLFAIKALHSKVLFALR